MFSEEDLIDSMASVELIYTVAYLLIAFCVVSPPTEFISAGLTVQSVLASFLGSEQMNFVYYHIKRTTATLVFHSFIPIAYYAGMILFTFQYTSYYFDIFSLSLAWRCYISCSLLLPCCASLIAYCWTLDQWGRHPIARVLQNHAPDGSTWRAISSSINVEFRRIDKFTSGQQGRKLIVTDSWVILTSTYSLKVAHQNDVHLNMLSTDEHELSHDSNSGTQFLNIMVISANEKIPPFKIRLNAVEYGDLREKLSAPIRNARNVVIRQTTSDRFLEAFRETVDRNEVFRKPLGMDVESCIGCMQTDANVKLQKLCNTLNQGDCIPCYCRPMWCLECMGKWFASRQDQGQPETWLSSTSPCPTCRSKFCMLDVCRVV